jgi:gluconolactonase
MRPLELFNYFSRGSFWTRLARNRSRIFNLLVSQFYTAELKTLREVRWSIRLNLAGWGSFSYACALPHPIMSKGNHKSRVSGHLSSAQAPLSRRAFVTRTLGAAAAMGALASARGQEFSQAEPMRYPDPRVIVLEKQFARYKLGNTGVQRLYYSPKMLWSEGCAWNAVGRFLLWSDIPNNRQLRWIEDDERVTTFRQPSGNSNGNTFDYQGRQLSCEHGNRRVVRYEHDGSVSVLADKWNGKPLNAPNDIVVHPEGDIWFTDPGYGSMVNYEGHKGTLEIKEAVYRIDAKTGKLHLVTDELHKPNGLCFSPDYKKLYISETGGPDPKPIMAYDVTGDHKLANGRKLCTMDFDGRVGGADGIRADVDGNIWAAVGWGSRGEGDESESDGEGYDGVHIFSPEGQRIGLILLPEVCANLCFGGEKRNRLFMISSQSLYALYVETQGAHIT